MTHTYSDVPPAAPSDGEPSFATPPVAPSSDFREPSLPAAAAESVVEPAAPAQMPAAKPMPPVERIPVWQAEITALHGSLDEARRRLGRVRAVYACAGLLGLAALAFQHLEIVKLGQGLDAAQQRADTLGAAMSMQQANLARLEQRVDALRRTNREDAVTPRYLRQLH
jgi:hypothetical protein